MHYSFHRRSMLALAALPLANAAAHATPATDTPVNATAPLTTENMVGKILRVVKSGDAMTMDYSEDRVNIEVDDKGTIVRVFIG